MTTTHTIARAARGSASLRAIGAGYQALRALSRSTSACNSSIHCASAVSRSRRYDTPPARRASTLHSAIRTRTERTSRGTAHCMATMRSIVIAAAGCEVARPPLVVPVER
eukprot:5228604-Prymnesium_polylepis.2